MFYWYLTFRNIKNFQAIGNVVALNFTGFLVLVGLVLYWFSLVVWFGSLGFVGFLFVLESFVR